ncbi:Cobalt-precorrin-5A hydrolase [Pseudomonas fluorescens]|uniref:cobalamin biosynthesis protein n=1 Tax=Pseudomonas fluorescens TaxID=294 RepID=UPI0012515965|nr:cobalamin biosynthesis protein [Pseudomonas fluorescens]CAG8863268.1 Cobalt-precorrin-5A hydrolase [Pseudomonas fluorescens]VVQ05582.1 Cobalt-precorrin-5A hydrolase [Pseudomonas fluorescens]
MPFTRVERAALYAGIGCRRGCPASELAVLLQQVLATQALPFSAVKGLASIDGKSDEPGMHQLAAQLGLPLMFFSAVELAPFEAQLSHRSPTAWQHTGCWGVAESAALAMAATTHPGPVHLHVTRQASSQATLALACSAVLEG